MKVRYMYMRDSRIIRRRETYIFTDANENSTTITMITSQRERIALKNIIIFDIKFTGVEVVIKFQ